MKAAIWARVSSVEQSTSNQLDELREWAARRGLEVVAEFVTEDSAWAANGKGSGKGAEFDARRAELLDGARLGRYQVVLCWGLDRLSRRGAEDMLAYVRRLTETGCALWSSKDPWVETMSDAFAREMLLSVFATIARFESQRRSERIRAGIARRKRDIAAGRLEGTVGGRQPGSTNRKPRPELKGEAAGWTPERREAQAARNRAAGAGQWTPERRLKVARANHQRRCPVAGCQETGEHPLPGG